MALRQQASARRIAHIDGLRAIAVIAVVGYHAGIPGFDGGFVGVDVFFAISGYLIINHIVEGLRDGSFSLMQFYARRAVRLLPPLLVVLLASTVLAAILLVSPYEWEWFTLSAVTASLSVSNFYFLIKQGYFDIDAWAKPLLHTWSLGVEEQFYLAVPLLLMACFALAARFRSLPWQRMLAVAAAVIFLLSLAGSILQTPVDGRNSGFYLPHWRAWEFVIGGLVGFAVARPASTFRPVIGEASGVAGLLLIAFSILQYRADWVYPGYLALLPATGAAMVIAAGLLNPHARSMRLLSLPILTGIGLVSYGWYLWHWPLISFARIAQFGDASLVRDLAMAAMSLGLAVVTYRYVEQPALAWRQRRSLQLNGPGIVLSGIAASLASACVAGAVGGLAYWSTMQDPALTDKSAEFAAAAECPAVICGLAANQHGSLIGDSHADRLGGPVFREAQRLGIAIDRNAVSADSDFAIVVRRWGLFFEEARAGVDGKSYASLLASEIAELSDEGRRRILIIGPTVEFAHPGAQCVLRAQRYGVDWRRCAVSRQQVEDRRKRSVAVLRRIAGSTPNARYAEPIGMFCDEHECRPYRDGVVLMKDRDHLTMPYGADWLFEGLKEDFWWAFSGNLVPGTDLDSATPAAGVAD
jgi:peptidoglycan/LPS O-acetylase OafA/YrhL